MPKNNNNKKRQPQEFAPSKSASRKSKQEAKQKKEDPYKTQRTRGYTPDPEFHLYQNNDVKISDRDEIQDLENFNLELEDKIKGDFDLNECGAIVRKGDYQYIKTGALYSKVKITKLYNTPGNDFEGQVIHSYNECCEVVFQKSRSHCDRYITAANLGIYLYKQGFDILPKCESQAREITKYPQAEWRDRWHQTSTSLKPHELTAINIKNFNKEVKEVEEEPRHELIDLPRSLGEVICRYAYALGMSVENYVIWLLLEIFKVVDPRDNWRKKKKLEKWELDLQKLIEEDENIRLKSEIYINEGVFIVEDG